MAKKFTESMFEKVQKALKKTERVGNAAYMNIMKFPAGHTYTVRLVPNVDNVDDTFFHHYMNQWTSKKDGSFVSVISLKTFNERDPITEARWKLYKAWKDTDPDKDEKFENPIKEKEQWYVNIYVVDDPSNPENNGKVKILAMGPQLKAIVDDAMTGDSSDEFGISIFDLSKDGCDFKIKADEQGIFTTYVKSRFSTKTSLDLSDEEIDEVYANMHDLKQVNSVRTHEELEKLLNEHFYCDGEPVQKEQRKPLPKVDKTKPVTSSKTKTKVSVPVDDDDDIPMTYPKNEVNVDELLDELDIE